MIRSCHGNLFAVEIRSVVIEQFRPDFQRLLFHVQVIDQHVLVSDHEPSLCAQLELKLITIIETYILSGKNS